MINPTTTIFKDEQGKADRVNIVDALGVREYFRLPGGTVLLYELRRGEHLPARTLKLADIPDAVRIAFSH